MGVMASVAGWMFGIAITFQLRFLFLNPVLGATLVLFILF
tara:strand:+ start:1233 stop:1352 length:120 start_codon:yes stop_codon:yes gene_type:complete